MVRLIVLGAGPAGLEAALGARERGFEVHVLEKSGRVGGNAGSFELEGVRVDYGSHRLHPAAEPPVLARLRALLGSDLLERPRRGRIRLGGRWIRFPPRPLDLAVHLPPRFSAGVARDVLMRGLRRHRGGPETFASVMERGLGPTVSREFYFPFARKIWGVEPGELSPEQALRRVSAGTVGKLVRRVLPRVAGGDSRKGVFYYPRGGYGQISERLAEAAVGAGARLTLGADVREVRTEEPAVRVDGDEAALGGDLVWSTIPLTQLARLARPEAPRAVLDACDALRFRALVLVYLVLGVGRFRPYDAHYFPESELLFSRVSEPKNYSGRSEPAGRTVLCAEVPCSVGDATWTAGDEELGERVVDGLARGGLPLAARPLRVEIRRLPNAYPVYDLGYERHFDVVDAWASGSTRVLSFGRQGLFAHDNTHHAMAMARAAVACLADDGRFDADAWRRARAGFAEHVVED